jgi:hypothetical protein
MRQSSGKLYRTCVYVKHRDTIRSSLNASSRNLERLRNRFLVYVSSTQVEHSLLRLRPHLMRDSIHIHHPLERPYLYTPLFEEQWITTVLGEMVQRERYRRA